MRKRLLSLLLAVLLLVSVMPTAAMADCPVHDYECDICGVHKCDHTFVQGVCSKCGYVCGECNAEPEKMVCGKVCTKCGLASSYSVHSFKDGYCEHCSKECDKCKGSDWKVECGTNCTTCGLAGHEEHYYFQGACHYCDKPCPECNKGEDLEDCNIQCETCVMWGPCNFYYGECTICESDCPNCYGYDTSAEIECESVCRICKLPSAYNHEWGDGDPHCKHCGKSCPVCNEYPECGTVCGKCGFEAEAQHEWQPNRGWCSNCHRDCPTCDAKGIKGGCPTCGMEDPNCDTCKNGSLLTYCTEVCSVCNRTGYKHDWSNRDGICANPNCGEVCPHDYFTNSVCDECGWVCKHHNYICKKDYVQYPYSCFIDTDKNGEWDEGEEKCEFLSDAIADVADTQTIKLLADYDGGETFTLPASDFTGKSFSFTLDCGEYTCNAVFAAKDGYTMTEKDGTYTFDHQINAITGTLTCADITVGETPAPTGVTAKYGDIVYRYSADGNTWGDWKDINHGVGTYFVKAVVKATENYDGAESRPVIFTVKTAGTSESTSEKIEQQFGIGSITSAVKSENAPKEVEEVAINTKDILNAAADKEDYDKVAEGQILDVWVELKEADKEEKDVKAAYEGFDNIAKEEDGSTIAAVVDIDLLKCLHDKDADQDQINNDKQEIKEINDPIKITITLPDSLRKDNVTYSLIRYHDYVDGREPIEKIPAEYNSETGELTFETDKFCPFGILTKEVDTPDDPDEPTNTLKAFLAKIFTFYSTLILFLGKLGWAVCT